MEFSYKEILFNEELHEYTNDKNEKYISVTTLIGKYAAKYDTEFWSMYTALKDRHYRVKPYPEKQEIMVAGQMYKLKDLQRDKNFRTFQDLTKAQWAATTAEACIKGSSTHNFLEDNINTSKGDSTGSTNINIQPRLLGNNFPIIATSHDLAKTDIAQRYPYIYNRLLGYIERGCSIYAEKRVHLDEYKVAGMIDVPIFKDQGFCILDWKTNKDEIQPLAGYYKKEKIGGQWVKTDVFVSTGEKMLYPIAHLEASTYNKYALQLSIYAYILECWGFKLFNNGLEIIHIRDNREPQVIKMPYLKKEVQLILEHYKEVA